MYDVRSYVVLLILLFTMHTSIFLSYLCITKSSLNRSHRLLNECFRKYAPRSTITVAAHEPTYSNPHATYLTSTLVLLSLSERMTVRSIETLVEF
jgi:hypothetical protein